MKGGDIRIVTKQEFLTSQILVIFITTSHKTFLDEFYSVNPEKHENYTHKQQWRVRGEGAYFILLRRNSFMGKS